MKSPGNNIQRTMLTTIITHNCASSSALQWSFFVFFHHHHHHQHQHHQHQLDPLWINQLLCTLCLPTIWQAINLYSASCRERSSWSSSSSSWSSQKKDGKKGKDYKSCQVVHHPLNKGSFLLLSPSIFFLLHLHPHRQLFSLFFCVIFLLLLFIPSH